MSSRPSRLISAAVTDSAGPRSSVCFRNKMLSSPTITDPRSITSLAPLALDACLVVDADGCQLLARDGVAPKPRAAAGTAPVIDFKNARLRSEEHTSELQSHSF